MKHRGLLIDAYVALTAARGLIAAQPGGRAMPTINRVDDVLSKIQVVVGEGVVHRAAKAASCAS
jgi:hypothetical protein